MKHTIGKGLSALILCSGLTLIPVSAQTGSGGNTATAGKSDQSQSHRKTGNLSASDRQFIQKAAEGGKAEVELGQLAVDKGSSPEVKQFGQRMVDDHSKANQELQMIASEKGVNIPDKLSPKDEATKARLEKLSGKEFDQAYMHSMVADHTKDVSEFRTEASAARDPDVKSFAQKTLPTLQDHLKMAKHIAPKNTVASTTSK